jgi:hypothetical protein
MPISVTLAAIMIATFATLGLGGVSGERACDRQVQVLAKKMAETVGLGELKLQLADAGLLCSRGDAAGADKALSGIARALRDIEQRSSQ